jgi:hypothetical protein
MLSTQTRGSKNYLGNQETLTLAGAGRRNQRSRQKPAWQGNGFILAIFLSGFSPTIRNY